MINKYLKIKLENILIDNGIEIINEFKIPETISIYKLNNGFNSKVESYLKKLPKIVKDIDRYSLDGYSIKLYTNSQRDIIIALYSRVSCNLQTLLTSDTEIKLDSEESELIKIDIEDDSETKETDVEIKKEDNISSECLMRNLDEYIELVNSILEKYGKVTDNVGVLKSIELDKEYSKDLSDSSELLFNQLNRTMYLFTEKKPDKTEIKQIQDKLNEKSLFQWELRVTEVERDGKFTIASKFFTRNSDIFNKDFGNGTTFRLYLEDNNSGEVYSQSEDIVDIYFDTYDKSTLYVTMKHPIDKIHDITQNCRLKVFKYNLRIADKITNETVNLPSNYNYNDFRIVPEYVDTVFIRDKVNVSKSKIDNNSNFYTIKLL